MNMLIWLRDHIFRMDVFLTIIGALLGWGISHFYYLKSLNDIKADVEERKRIENLFFQGIESIGTIKYSRDSDGKIVGVIIELKGSASSNASTTGDLTVSPSQVQNEPPN